MMATKDRKGLDRHDSHERLKGPDWHDGPASDAGLWMEYAKNMGLALPANVPHAEWDYFHEMIAHQVEFAPTVGVR